jgi:hypothetical protein
MSGLGLDASVVHSVRRATFIRSGAGNAAERIGELAGKRGIVRAKARGHPIPGHTRGDVDPHAPKDRESQYDTCHPSPTTTYAGA